VIAVGASVMLRSAALQLIDHSLVDAVTPPAPAAAKQGLAKPETDVGQEPERDRPGSNAAGNNKHYANNSV